MKDFLKILFVMIAVAVKYVLLWGLGITSAMFLTYGFGWVVTHTFPSLGNSLDNIMITGIFSIFFTIVALVAFGSTYQRISDEFRYRKRSVWKTIKDL